jgi:hypothetical protein
MARQQLDAAWRGECGVTSLSMPAARLALWQACSYCMMEASYLCTQAVTPDGDAQRADVGSGRSTLRAA